MKRHGARVFPKNPATGITEKLLVIGAAKGVNCLDQCGCMFRFDLGVNAMAEVEHVAVAVAKTLQNTGDFLAYRVRRGIQHAGINITL